MSVAAAELPAMAGEASPDRAGTDAIRARLDAGLVRIAFFVMPSAVAFLALGDVVAAAILQTGRFAATTRSDVWGILAGSAVGLLASTLGPLVLVRLLRASRYEQTSSVCRHPRVAHARARLAVRPSCAWAGSGSLPDGAPPG